MLRVFSEQIVADLNAFPGLIALLDANGVSALISEQEDGDSFVNYAIKYNGRITKDGAASYQVFIDSWSDTYSKSIAIADEVANALGASVNSYSYLDATSVPELSTDNKISVVTKQIFNINK